jgi:heat shock protein HslJ
VFPFLVLVLVALGCVGGAGDDAEEVIAAIEAPPRTAESIKAELGTLDKVSGSFSAGDGTVSYDGYFEGDQLVYVHALSDYGDYGWEQAEFFLHREMPFQYRRISTVTVLDPQRAGETEEKQVEIAFDGFARPVRRSLTVDGAEQELPAHEAAGAIQHLRSLAAAAARGWSEQRTPDAAALQGSYTAELEAAANPERTVTLLLQADHKALLRTEYDNDEPPVVEEGFWKALGRDRAAVRLMIKNGHPARSSAIVFELDGETLRAKEFDTDDQAYQDLVLERRPDPFAAQVAGVVWQWQAFVTPKESIDVDDPASYTIQFQPDGNVAIRADCNRGFGAYEVTDGRNLSFGPFGVTRAMCPPESLSDRYLIELERVNSFFVKDGQLYMELPYDSGTLVFSPQ